MCLKFSKTVLLIQTLESIIYGYVIFYKDSPKDEGKLSEFSLDANNLNPMEFEQRVLPVR
jgi:hypothetical protein